MYCDLNQKHENSSRRRVDICRSTFLTAEEIARERAESGWNPYAGEEIALSEKAVRSSENEIPLSEKAIRSSENEIALSEKAIRFSENEIALSEKAMQLPNEASAYTAEDAKSLEKRGLSEPAQEFRPVFRGPDYEQILEEQKNVERDLRSLQSMYPEAAKILLPYVEEMCDKLEYEGSMMFDRFPDQTTLYRMQDAILEQAKEEFSEVPAQEEPDEVFSMQYRGRRHPPGKNWLGDMIRVLLLQEMHHRRCRHRNCRWR